MPTTNTTNIRTLSDLRLDLIQVYNELRNGTLPLGEAKEISNMAGKIISTLKVEIAYEIHRGNIKSIDFLENKLIEGNNKAVVNNIPEKQLEETKIH